jgi:hypothetical protein
LQERINWNVDLRGKKKNEEYEEDEDKQVGKGGFFNENDLFGELTLPMSSSQNKKTSSGDKSATNDEVYFDDKTGKLIIQQKKIEKQTGLKRTIDAFEADKIEKLVDATKVN